MANTLAPLLTPSELKALYPLTSHQVQEQRETIRRILNGQDNRQLLIVGPCSIHNSTEALDYARKLKILAEEVKSTFYPIMRVYFEKPRTGLGWKGLLHDPQLNGEENIELGLNVTRELLVNICKIGIPIASEFLDPLSIYYLSDTISWGSIGARTPESQVHRLLASSLPFPIGFKNSTSGCILGALSGIRVAAQPHNFIGINDDGKACSIRSSGNPDSHLVLRGGKDGPNYHQEAVDNAIEMSKEYNIKPKLIIDCSHGNSSKVHTNQPEVLKNVIEQILSGTTAIRGVMLESHLNAGNQTTPQKYGVSITDSCISWETTREIVLEAQEQLTFSQRNSPQYAAKS